jgi:hypothetical protein
VHREQLDGGRGTLLPLDDYALWADAILSATNGNGAPGSVLGTADMIRLAADEAQRTDRTFINIMHEAMCL